MAYVRTVKTASGATAVQIVWSSRRGSRSIEHVGSAHDEAELAALKAAAAERLAAGQAVLDLGVAGPPGSEPLPITSSQMTHLWEGLCAAYRVLGFESATKGDNVFRDLVLARIIEPTSKIDAERVLSEVGVEAASYATVKRRLPGYAKPAWRQALAAACAARAAGAGLVWCCSTCRRCTSRPMPVTVSASPGSPRNAAWNRRSRWAVDRRVRIPADRRGVRGQQGRDRHHAAGHQRLQGRSPAH